jgi:DNA-directed RNA polymerase specialized sigma24 family protein
MTDEDLLFILKKIPSELLDVFYLNIIDGYSHQEISELINISVLSSRKKPSRVRQWLESTFRNDEKTIIYLQNSISQAL